MAYYRPPRGRSREKGSPRGNYRWDSINAILDNVVSVSTKLGAGALTEMASPGERRYTLDPELHEFEVLRV